MGSCIMRLRTQAERWHFSHQPLFSPFLPNFSNSSQSLSIKIHSSPSFLLILLCYYFKATRICVQGIRRLTETTGWGQREAGGSDEVGKALRFYRCSVHARKSSICLQIKSAQGSVTTVKHNRLNLTKRLLIKKRKSVLTGTINTPNL